MNSTNTSSSVESVSEQLAAAQLANDPRVAQAKKLLMDAVAEHQASIDSVRPPAPDMQSEYRATLEAFGQVRGGNLYFPYLSSGLGNGPYVELADGSVKLDLITGIGVHGFGHSDLRLIEAGVDATLSDTVMQGNLQQGMPSVDFSNLLFELANESGAELAHVFMSTSGAMANENALKIAFQKNHPADRILAFEHCFAGRTLGLANLTDKAAYRNGLPDTIKVDYLPFYDAAEHDASIARTLAVLDEHLKRHPNKYAALWMEVIQGEGGYYPGNHDFFVALIQAAKKQGIAIIVDEVQSFCRTSRPFAFQHFELDQHVDIVTIGKISQVCATLYREEFKPKPGLISQTFTGSTWAMLAGKAIIGGLVESGNFGPDGKNMNLFAYFESGLKSIAEKYPQAVSGPYGLGGMVVFTPFDGSIEKAKQMVGLMYDAGLMSFIAGASPVRIRFLMPLGCVTNEHIDAALAIIENAAAEMS